MSRFQRYAAFSKVTPQPDGTLVVEGIASSESVDSQGEIVRAEAMRKAIPAYMKFGNIREMHDAIAAGKAMAISVDDQGVTHLTAHVVDSESCKKVSAGVLQGFSIGGSVPPGGRSKADNSVIEQIDLTEISLVDRPANPDALITLVKMDAAEPPPAAAAEAAAPPPAAPAPEAQKAEAPPPVKKGLYTVSRAAELLQSLAYLAESTAYEAEGEGDGSPIPDQLKAQVTALCGTLRAMVAEETAELQASLTPAPDVLASAEAAPPVQKKGAKFSTATAKAIGAIHDQIKACDEAMGKLGYTAKDDGGDDVASAAQVGDLAKRASDAEAATAAAGEALAKVLGERDDLQKRADDLAKQLEAAKNELAKKPLRAVPVSKGEDATGVIADDPADPLLVIKKIHATGGRRIA